MDCVIVYTFMTLGGTPSSRCLYFGGIKMYDDVNYTDPFTHDSYGLTDYFNVTCKNNYKLECKNKNCKNCHPDFINCVACWDDYYVSTTVLDCSLSIFVFSI